MAKPTLLILAAGMGSRYGGLKQMDHFGPGGETIIDYSIYDAIKAGFGKIVFIIRKSFGEDFRNLFDEKLKNAGVEVDYVYQELDSYLGDHEVPEGRTKPWGTAHAMLCAKDAIQEPFAIINSDDFYGREPFELAAKFLNEESDETKQALLGYHIDNTLSANGHVNRGVCEVDENGHLVTITERSKIAIKEGKYVYPDENGKDQEIPSGTTVSMNFWAFHPSFFEITEKRMEVFLKEERTIPKAEFLIPSVVDYYIKTGMGDVKVIPTTEKWFGVTYQEDAPPVREGIRKLIADNVYPEKLWT